MFVKTVIMYGHVICSSVLFQGLSLKIVQKNITIKIDVIINVTVFCIQDSQQWLGRLIPDKQSLSDQLKHVQQNSLHRKSSAMNKIIAQHFYSWITNQYIWNLNRHVHVTFLSDLLCLHLAHLGDSLSSLQKVVEQKEMSRQQLREQLDAVERETRAKLLEIDAFNTQLKVNRLLPCSLRQKNMINVTWTILVVVVVVLLVQLLL